MIILNVHRNGGNRTLLKRILDSHNFKKDWYTGQKTPFAKISKEELQKLVDTSDTFTEIFIKLGYNKPSGGKFALIKKKIKEWGIDTSNMTHRGKCHGVTKRSLKDTKENDSLIFRKDNGFCRATLRRYIIRHNKIPYECAVCGNKGEWNGKPLTLTLDHINGNHNDNRLENLRFICPNCDRQSETYGSKNKVRYYKSGGVTETD